VRDLNKAERIFRLHRALNTRTVVSLNKLMEKLEVSRSTIKRDIAYMRDFMNAPIIYIRSANGYKYKPDSPAFELPGLWFNESELYALLATNQLLESVQPGLLSPYIGPLKVRIKNLLEQSGHQSEKVTSRIRLQTAAQRKVDPTIFGCVTDSLLNSRCLHIEYHGRQRGTKTSRLVHPYQLIHYRDNWYLVGFCEQAKDYRYFSLDRIYKTQIQQKNVHQYEEQNLAQYINASFGIFSGEATNWAVLRFTSQRAQWVADESWHPDQIGRWFEDEYELQVPYSDERELLMEILKYGPDVEVITPEELRNMVSKKLHLANQKYHKVEDK